MLKRILISILSVLIILIMITGVFHYFVKVCDEYLLPENGAVDYDAVDDAENRTVEYVFSFDAPTGEFSSKGTTSSVCSKLVVVIGRINTERRYYYISRESAIASTRLPFRVCFFTLSSAR